MRPGLLPQGYLLEIYQQHGDSYDHRFCGKHDIAGADCPNCAQPLLRFFSFDMRDSRLARSVAPRRGFICSTAGAAISHLHRFSTSLPAWEASTNCGFVKEAIIARRRASIRLSDTRTISRQRRCS